MGSEVRGRRSPSHAALERDAALGRVGRTKRWAIFGAAGLTAAFAALVSSVAPGKTLGKTSRTAVREATTSTTRPRSSGSTKMPPLASPSQLGLQGPAAAPQSDPSQSAPAQTTPAQTTPAQTTPAQTTPAPVQQAPAPATSGGS